jgi:hypothetical protein
MTWLFKKPCGRLLSPTALLLLAATAYGQTTGRWEQAPGAANDIAASKAGVFVVGSNGPASVGTPLPVFRWEESAKNWTNIGFPSTTISVDDQGALWGINNGTVFHRVAGGAQGTERPHSVTNAISVSAEPGGEIVWALDASGTVWARRRSSAPLIWERVVVLPGNNKPVQIVADPAFGFYIVTASPGDGGIYRYNKFGQFGSKVNAAGAFYRDLRLTPAGGWYGVTSNTLYGSTAGNGRITQGAFRRVAYQPGGSAASPARIWILGENTAITAFTITPGRQLTDAYVTAARNLTQLLQRIVDTGTAQTTAPQIDSLMGPYLIAKKRAEYWIYSDVNSAAEVATFGSEINAADSALEQRRTELLRSPWAASVSLYLNTLTNKVRTDLTNN